VINVIEKLEKLVVHKNSTFWNSGVPMENLILTNRFFQCLEHKALFPVPERILVFQTILERQPEIGKSTLHNHENHLSERI
jgi:hypothetical protein